MPKITNLYFDGGGVKAFAYIGAVEEAINSGYIKLEEIERVAGVSAGAISALMIALGYDIDSAKQLVKNINFEKFVDASGSALWYAHSIYKNLGASSGKYPLKIFKKMIKDATGSEDTTFKQLHELILQQKAEHGKSKLKDLYTLGINLNSQETEIFSYEHKHADLPIATAIRISMSIPIVYIPVKINGDTYIDGGFIDGYQIEIFDKLKYFHHWPSSLDIEDKKLKNPHTLGFTLYSEFDKEPPIRGLIGFMRAMSKTIAQAQEKYMHLRDNESRTIKCNALDIDTTEFALSDERLELLIESGRKNATDFIENRKLEESSRQGLRRVKSSSDLTKTFSTSNNVVTILPAFSLKKIQSDATILRSKPEPETNHVPAAAVPPKDLSPNKPSTTNIDEVEYLEIDNIMADKPIRNNKSYCILL